MTRKQGHNETSSSKSLPNLLVSRAEAKKKINERIGKAHVIVKGPIGTDQGLDDAKALFRSWDDYNTDLLKKLFDTTDPSNEYSHVAARVYWGGANMEQRIQQHKHGVQKKIDRLASIKDRLDLYEEPPLDDSLLEKTVEPVGNSVFIVHGRDEAAKQQVARFLETLDLTPVILREQPNIGRTLIEKFEAHSEVAYAVVLLTPDDEGREASTTTDEQAELAPRARQNVIFELGYFMGNIGRQRVCALYREGIELPSDYEGIVYVPYDQAEGWKLELAKELSAAGLDVDMNKLIACHAQKNGDPHWKNRLQLTVEPPPDDGLYRHIKVENRHGRKHASNCYGHLKEAHNASTGKEVVIPHCELKWELSKVPNIAIFAKASRRLDAF